MIKFLSPVFLFLFLSFTPYQKQESADLYVGIYHFPTGSNLPQVQVKEKDNRLILSGAFGSTWLVPTKVADEFTLLDFDGKATFLRDSIKRKITKIHLVIDNVSFDEEGDKIDFDDYGIKE